MTRKMLEQMPNELLQQDLEKYRQRAIELAAEDARIITTDMILIDDRVRTKCIVPRCESYGTNACCPPYGMELEFVRKVVNNFHYGIFTMFTVSAEVITGHDDYARNERLRTQIQNLEMICKIEAEAFYDGYHLAMGFAGGTCKILLCADVECSALISGQGCRYPLRARASMEGAGMDAFTMATKVGWDIYPIGPATLPSEVPHGLRLGLVLIY